MINHLLIILCSISIYEFLRYIKFINIVKLNFKINKKIIKLAKLRKVSDFRKEKLILNYSKSLFLISIKIFTIIVSIFIFINIFSLLSNTFLNFVISIFGIIELSIFFVAHHFFREKIYAKL